MLWGPKSPSTVADKLLDGLGAWVMPIKLAATIRAVWLTQGRRRRLAAAGPDPVLVAKPIERESEHQSTANDLIRARG